MKYVRQQVTEFLSTNIPEPVPEYSPSTTYIYESGEPTNDSLVRVGSFIYRSLINDNQDNDPLDPDNLRTKWVRWAPSNAYSMLDMKSATKTTVQSTDTVIEDIIVEVAYTYGMDTLVIGNYASDGFLVEMIDGSDNVLWSYTQGGNLNEDVIDYWTYTYSEYGYEADRALMVNLGSFTNTVKIRVTLYGQLEQPTECGYLVIGEGVEMGKTLRNVKFNFNSFTLKQFDDFGTATIIKRAIQDITDFETVIDSGMVPTMKRRIKSVYDDVVAFVVDESENSEYENLITLGTVQDASVIHDNHVESVITWSIVEIVA